MPRVAYSEEERERIRVALVRVGLDLMTKQGIQHTTVEQIYRRVGISRTFFYSFFPTKEDLIVETLYLQQPKIVAYARKLMADPALSWRDGVRQFLHACCYGEKNGIAVLTIEEQQLIFKRLSKESVSGPAVVEVRLDQPHSSGVRRPAGRGPGGGFRCLCRRPPMKRWSFRSTRSQMPWRY